MRTGRSLAVCRVGCVCSRGGVCSGGGVVVSQHALRQTPPPVDRITDTSKNITLASTSLRPVMKPSIRCGHYAEVKLHGRADYVFLSAKFYYARELAFLYCCKIVSVRSLFVLIRTWGIQPYQVLIGDELL